MIPCGSSASSCVFDDLPVLQGIVICHGLGLCVPCRVGCGRRWMLRGIPAWATRVCTARMMPDADVVEDGGPLPPQHVLRVHYDEARSTIKWFMCVPGG